MKFVLTSAALLLSTTGAIAQGFTGATVGFEYSDLNDIDNASSTLLYGSAEFEVTSGVSVAVDLSNRSFEDFDEEVSNLVVHGIYAISPDVKIGAFLGRETVNDQDIDNYGVEVAYAAGAISTQAYLGAGEVESESADLTYLGASGGYDLGNGVSVIGGFESVTIDEGGGDSTYSTIEIGGEYAMRGGPAFFANVGQLSLDNGSSDSENYFELGATFSFGPQGGTTFGPRGLFDVIPFAF